MSLSPQSFDIFCEHVGFEVDERSGFAFAQGGYFVSVRNDPNAESLFGNFGDGQADAVDGDRSFENEVAHQFARRFNFEKPIGAAFFEDSNFTNAIDVAGDEVAVQAFANSERAFEINGRTDLQGLKVR